MVRSRGGGPLARGGAQEGRAEQALGRVLEQDSGFASTPEVTGRLQGRGPSCLAAQPCLGPLQ